MKRLTLGLLMDHQIGEYQEELRDSVERAAFERGANLITVIGRALDAPRAKEAALNHIYDLVTPARFAGVVIAGVVGTQCSEARLEALSEGLAPLPRCTIGVRVPGVPALAINDKNAMRLMMDHMVGHGCRRIAFIRGPRTSWEAERRYQAYTECLEANGIEFSPGLVAIGNFDLPSGMESMSAILANGEPFDCVVASNDHMALGAAEVLQARAIRIPHRVLLGGFDDFPLARFANPPLTSVRQPLLKLGQLAVETLFALIEQRPVSALTEVASELVLRQSCGCGYKVLRGRKSTLSRGQDQTPLELLRARAGLLRNLMSESVRIQLDALDAWFDTLLQALERELSGTAGSFLQQLEDLLELAVRRHEPVDEFHAVISILRAELRPLAGGAQDLDELWHAAGVLVGITSARAEGRERLASEFAASVIRESIARLSTTLSHEALKAGLLDLLPAVKIPRSLVALYDGADTSRLRYFFGTEGAHQVELEVERFSAAELVPAAFIPEERSTSLIVQPLTFETEQLGVVALQSGASSVVYDILREQISASLKGAALHQSVVRETSLRERAEHAQLQGELRIAAQIQTAILPVDVQVPWLNVAAQMVPALEVGGDYYDIHPTENACWVGIGDVTGHGLRAGLIMLMIQSMASSLIQQAPDSDPSTLVNCLNEALYRNVRERLSLDDHATFSLVRIEPSGKLIWAGAHEDLLVLRAASGKCEDFPAKGVWVGARRHIEDATEEQSIELRPGDRVVLYTDGLIEAMDAHHQQFGLERLVELIEAKRALSNQDLCGTLVVAAKSWATLQLDDITVVVLEYAPEA